MYEGVLFVKRFFSYVKNAGLYFGSSLLVAIIGVLLNPIFAMNLSHEDYAIIGYYTSFNVFLIPLLHCCLISYYSRQYFFISEKERTKLENTILSSIILIGSIVLGLFLMGFYLIHKMTKIDFPFFPFALLAFLQLYISNITTFYTTKLRISRKAKRFALVTVSQCLITSLGALLLVVCYKYGATGKLLGTLIGSIIIAIYSYNHSGISFSIDRKILSKALEFCWPLILSAVLWYFLTGVDRMFLVRLNNVKELGLYSIGTAIASYMAIFYTTLSSTFQPDIYKAIAEKKSRKLLLINMLILSVVIIVNILFVVLAPWLIGLLTFNRYVDATPYVQIITLSNITTACYYMIVNIIVGFGYTKQELIIRIFGAIISVLLYKYLVAHNQFVGAAWGQVLSFVIMSIFGLVLLVIMRRGEKVEIQI